MRFKLPVQVGCGEPRRCAAAGRVERHKEKGRLIRIASSASCPRNDAETSAPAPRNSQMHQWPIPIRLSHPDTRVSAKAEGRT